MGAVLRAGFAFNGALVTLAANQNTANYTAGAMVPFDSETYDTDGWHDNATNNSRLTVPSGVTKVNVWATIRVTSGTAGDLLQANLAQNGTTLYTADRPLFDSAGIAVSNIFFGGVPCVAGDYFELQITISSDTSVTVVAARTFFGSQAVG